MFAWRACVCMGCLRSRRHSWQRVPRQVFLCRPQARGLDFGDEGVCTRGTIAAALSIPVRTPSSCLTRRVDALQDKDGASGNPDLFYNRANVREVLRACECACAACVTMAVLCPPPVCVLLLEQVLMFQEEYDQAVESYRKAHSIDPSLPADDNVNGIIRHVKRVAQLVSKKVRAVVVGVVVSHTALCLFG